MELRSCRWLVAGTAALAVAVAGCGGGEEGSAGSAVKSKDAPAKIADKGRLTACMDVSFPPMEYYATAGSRKPTGFDVDLVSAIAKRWGVKAQFSETSFDGLLPALSSGRCDLVASGIFITKERTATFPAVGYLKSRRVLLVPKGNPKQISTLEALSGKTAATQTATQYEKTLRQLDKQLRGEGKPGIKVQSYPKASDAVQQLVVGRADAVYTQDTEAAFRAKAQPGQFEIAYSDPSAETFGVYHRRDDQDLGKRLQDALKRMQQEGTLAELAKRWGLPQSGTEF